MPDLSSLVGAATSQMRSDPVMFWTEVLGITGAGLGLIAGLLIARGNARMHRETQEMLAQRNAELEAAQAAVDALAGRPAAPCEPENQRTL